MIWTYGILDAGMSTSGDIMFFQDDVLGNVEYDTISSRWIYN